MMTSVVTDAARGNRDRALQQTTHTSQPQKQIQVSNTHTPSVRFDIMIRPEFLPMTVF